MFLRFTGVLLGSRSFNRASLPGGRPRAMARLHGEADDSVPECVSVHRLHSFCSKHTRDSIQLELHLSGHFISEWKVMTATTAAATPNAA